MALYLPGIDLTLSKPDLALESVEPGALVHAMHRALAGSLTHALLEWSAFCAALLEAGLGVAEGPAEDGWKTVLDLGDKALYRAKAGGRNRLEVTEIREAA